MGHVPEFSFSPGVRDDARVFHKATPLPPDRRAWVRKEMAALVDSGVVERTHNCRCASNVVLVD